MKKFIKILIVGLALLMTQIAIYGQATTGSLRGTVVDTNGNVVANASVKIKNENTGGETLVTSNGEGAFSVPSLLPGSYTVTTEASGFKRSVKTGITVNLGTVSQSDIKLEAGNVSETVTVTANGETLQTEQSQVTGTIDTRRVEELPSNGAGGGIDTLALLIPGVVANRTGGTNKIGRAHV